MLPSSGHRLCWRAIRARNGHTCLLRRSELGQPFKQLLLGLSLDLFPSHCLSRSRVARRYASIFLGLVEVLNDSIAVLVECFLGNTLHAENFDLEALSVRKGIVDLAECFFVYLVQVNGEACSGLE